MLSTSSSRRAVGLLATATVGLSTAVLGVTGTASAAAPAPIDFFTVDGDTTVTVGAGYCAIAWDVVGGDGGGGEGDPFGFAGGQLQVLTAVTAGDTFDFAAGSRGESWDEGSSGGGNSLGHSGDDGDSMLNGGGGGGASEVLLDGDPFLLAYGGDGEGNGFGAGYGGGSNEYPADALHVEMDGVRSDVDEAGPSLDGYVAGTVVPCEAPGVVSELTVTPGDGKALLRFRPDGDQDELVAPVTGYEVSTNGGTTWQPVPSPQVDGWFVNAVLPLANGGSYDIVVRAQSAVGPGGGSNVVADVTPYHSVAAPGNVTATVGISSIRITWEAPAGETGITGYEAWAIPGAEPQSSHGMVSCTGLTATSRSCVIGVAPGERYSVGVAADNGHRGESAFVVSAVVPGSTVPDAVPAGDAPLATDKGAVSTVTAGQSVTLVGDGYLPGSTVTLVIYSVPTVLGTVVADANGKFTATVTVPAGLAAGSHSLVASGVDSSGAVRYLRMNVTVSAAGVATASSGGLALTGFTAFPFVAGGLLALAAGAGLLTASRRRAR